MSTTFKFAVSCLAGLAWLGTADVARPQERGPNQRPEVRGLIKSVDGSKTITLSMGGGRDVAATEKTFDLAKDVEVAIGGGGFRLGGLFKEGKLADLSSGLMVSVLLSADQKTVESIAAEEPMIRAVLKSVDVKNGTLTVSAAPGREPGADGDKTLTLAKDAEVAVDDGRGRRHSIREGKVEDLVAGAIVNLRLSLDKKQVSSVLAEGPMLMGTIKALDPAKLGLIVVLRPARGDEPAEERTLTLSKDAVIVVDDGKGRRLSHKESKLADVPTGSAVMLKLSMDQNSVMMLRAEGPPLFGLLKGVDAVKGSITIAIPKGRDVPEEKTLSLAKDARVTLDGNVAKLGDLKAGDNGPFIQLRLTLDQKTVQVVTARQPGPR